MSDINGKEIYERITALETQMKTVCNKLDRITDNHLPHIREDIKGINRKLYVAAGAIVALQYIIDKIL